MTETQQAAATQAANGQAQAPARAAPEDMDTGERWLGILVITAGVFLLFVGIDRVTGGALSGRLFDQGEADAGG